MMWVLIGVGGFLAVVTIHDLIQSKHSILRNFPVIGHLRYWLEAVGPELRQYIVTGNDEERPFSRDQRRWIYSSAKRQNSYFGFGTDNDLEQAPTSLLINHAAFPLTGHGIGEQYGVPCAKVVGAARSRAKAFRPESIINISGMSYGSLSANAIEALNRGSKIAGCMHNTGEGSISAHHQHGADLIWQLGTGYFGCRAEGGGFDKSRFLDVVADNPRVRAIEIKLSQGAKPGLGGMLPAAKVTAEISRVRGIPLRQDCASPPCHSEFGSADELLDFVEDLAAATGLPVGIKSAVGQLDFWEELARLMSDGQRGVDYIAIDGGEGGTGAAPLVFSDHVAMPFKLGMSRVYRAFAEQGLHEKVVFVGSAKLGFPAEALLGFALGCDMVHVAREAMIAIGCIQAQRCHSGHCPAGVATQNRWLMHGLSPRTKAVRLANYVIELRKEILQLSHAAGLEHPALIRGNQLELVDNKFGSRTIREVFDYQPGWGVPSAQDRDAIVGLMG